MSPQCRRRVRSLGPLRALLALASLAGLGCAELGLDAAAVGDLLGTGGGAGPTRSQVAAGLAEALRVGTERAVATTSRPGGFLDDPRLRIALPDELQTTAKAARAIGLGPQVDALEVTMNRAAEEASGQAVQVFGDAIGRMTIQDAFGILNGGDDAATRYFRQATEDSLRAHFEPVVASAMQEVGVYRAYDGLVSRYGALGLLGDPRASLDAHVTQATLDGLFSVLAREEKKIREDPAARTTALLRQVFGR
jgi:hypothetical protein